MIVKITGMETMRLEESLWGSFWEREKLLPLLSPMSIYPEYKHPITTWYWPSEILVVKVQTNDGLFGIGWAEDGTKSAEAIIHNHLKRFVLGQDPANIEVLWDQMFRSAIPYGRKGTAIQAISAIDIALWDLMGKAVRKPVYELLGGKVREKVPVYASHLHPIGLDKMVEEALGYVEQGYKAMKMRVAHGPADGAEGMSKNVEIVKTLRDAIGYDHDLMADAYMGWSLNYAKRIMKKLERYELAWVEEPLIPDDILALVELRKSTSIPIATGEHEFTRYGFGLLMELGAVDIVQPDVYRVGGFSEAKKVCGMASERGLYAIPHAGGVPNSHLVISTPNCPMAEYYPIPKWHKEKVEESKVILGEPDARNGFLDVPSGHGLGVTIDESKASNRIAVK